MLNRTSRLGLALSGGGIRAAIFHLGVLKYLAEAGHWTKIRSISTVSGASICMGAIFSCNKYVWPTKAVFLDKVLPCLTEKILNENIQRAAIARLPFYPAMWRHRVEMIAKMLEEKWGITGTMQDLPPLPFWEINCTTFETGGRWRFRKDYMGCHTVGYLQKPQMPVSHVVAASAAFPVFIGPYEIAAKGLPFTRDKAGKAGLAVVRDKYTLWDGGVYDNLGLDALHKVGGGLDREIDGLIVSNAGAVVGEQERGRPSQNLRRLLDISAMQSVNLRTRDFFASVVARGRGAYLKIGTVPQNADKSKMLLTPAEREFVQSYPTTLNSPTPQHFNLILNSGYETASYVL